MNLLRLDIMATMAIIFFWRDDYCSAVTIFCGAGLYCWGERKKKGGDHAEESISF